MYTVSPSSTRPAPSPESLQILERLRAQATPESDLAGKTDGYKFTSLRDVAWNVSDLPPPSVLALEHARMHSDIHESVLVISANGELRFDQPTDQLELQSLGIYIGRLSATPAALRAAVTAQPLGGALAHDPFANRARALVFDPIIILVPKDKQLTRPVRIVHVDQQSAAQVWVQVGAHSEVTVIEEYISEENISAQCESTDPLVAASPALFTGLTHVRADDGARLRYVSVQGFTAHVQPFIRQHLTAGRSAHIEHVSVTYGGGKGQTRIEAECSGSGARIEFKACARLDGSQHHDFWIHALHDTTDTSSTVDFWTVAADQSRVVFNGNLVITSRGLRTDAYQRNRNLMLSRRAVVDTIPKLEIATDDVKCAHGATISTVNSDQLYYLQSRGIARLDAEAMIIQGFTEPVVSLIPTPRLREYVAHALAAKNGASPEART